MAQEPEPKREPPAAVRRQLRRAVRFGCPIPGCRSPWLEYHHFDPEWHVRKHHDPDGMIPLCPTHHAQAEAWTPTQLRDFKTGANESPVEGRFEWMRQELVGVVGGSLYHETPRLVVLGDAPAIWFERDEDGHALLNVRMITLEGAGTPRLRVENNDFFVGGQPDDLECPPGGKRIKVRYPGGDGLRIRFRSVAGVEEASRIYRFSEGRLHDVAIAWPATFVEIAMSIGGSRNGFTATTTRWGGVHMTGGIISRCGAGLVIG